MAWVCLQGQPDSFSCISSANRTCSGKPDLLGAKPDVPSNLIRRITVFNGPGTERFGPACHLRSIVTPCSLLYDRPRLIPVTQRPVSTPRVGRARKISKIHRPKPRESPPRFRTYRSWFLSVLLTDLWMTAALWHFAWSRFLPFAQTAIITFTFGR